MLSGNKKMYQYITEDVKTDNLDDAMRYYIDVKTRINFRLYSNTVQHKQSLCFPMYVICTACKSSTV